MDFKREYLEPVIYLAERVMDLYKANIDGLFVPLKYGSPKSMGLHPELYKNTNAFEEMHEALDRIGEANKRMDCAVREVAAKRAELLRALGGMCTSEKQRISECAHHSVQEMICCQMEIGESLTYDKETGNFFVGIKQAISMNMEDEEIFEPESPYDI